MTMTPTAVNTHISTDWSDLLLPGLSSVFYNTLDESPAQFDKIFKIKKSTTSTVTELGMGAFSPWTERVNETDNVAFQKIPKGLERTYTHSEFASGFAIGKRLYEDELYGIIAKMPEDLARAGRSKVETDAVSVFNNAFAASGVTIYDGQPLCSAAHPRLDGGTAGDNLATGALSDTTLKAAINKMRAIKDEAGKLAVFTADTLIVPPGLEWLALELTKSTQKPGTADNDINTLSGRLKVFVWDYLTDSDAWFIMDSKRAMASFYWRVRPEFAKSNDSDNWVAKYAGRMRYSYGVSDWRGIVGSVGA